MSGASLKAKVVEKLLTQLSQDLVDEYEPGVIKPGPLQDSPLKRRISILQHDMDPLDPKSTNWVDRHYSAVPDDQRRFTMAVDEGTIQGWVLRGILEIVINLGKTKEDRETGYDLSDSIRERVMSSAMHAGIAGTVSGNQEWTAYFFTPTKLQTIEQGGSGSWMWRYYMYYEVYASWDPFVITESKGVPDGILQI